MKAPSISLISILALYFDNNVVNRDIIVTVDLVDLKLAGQATLDRNSLNGVEASNASSVFESEREKLKWLIMMKLNNLDI